MTTLFPSSSSDGNHVGYFVILIINNKITSKPHKDKSPATYNNTTTATTTQTVLKTGLVVEGDSTALP